MLNDDDWLKAGHTLIGGLRVERQVGRSSRPDAGSGRDSDACESALSHDRGSFDRSICVDLEGHAIIDRYEFL